MRAHIYAQNTKKERLLLCPENPESQLWLRSCNRYDEQNATSPKISTQSTTIHVLLLTATVVQPAIRSWLSCEMKVLVDLNAIGILCPGAGP